MRRPSSRSFSSTARVGCSIDVKSIRRVLEELKFLSSFHFKYCDKKVTIQIGHPNGFRVSIDGNWTSASDLNAAIQLIVGGAAEEPSV